MKKNVQTITLIRYFYSSSLSSKEMSSSTGGWPSFPSQGSTLDIFGNAAPFSGAVDPRPYERSLNFGNIITTNYNTTHYELQY